MKKRRKHVNRYGEFHAGRVPDRCLVIGAAAAVLVLFNGRIACISGILGGLLGKPRNDAGWRIAFLAGLVGAPVLASLLGRSIAPDIQAGWGEILIAGLLVGAGTRYASGCMTRWQTP
jgi:hypothetical protein